MNGKICHEEKEVKSSLGSPLSFEKNTNRTTLSPKEGRGSGAAKGTQSCLADTTQAQGSDCGL